MREIEIEDAWDALQNFNPVNLKHTLEPLHKVPDGAINSRTVVPTTQVLASTFGLDLIADIGNKNDHKNKHEKTYPKPEEILPTNLFEVKEIKNVTELDIVEIYEKERIAMEFFK